MKVNSASVQAPSKDRADKSSKSRPSKEEIKARIQKEFGIKIGKKPAAKSEKSDTVVSIDSKGKKEVKDDGFGDIKNNHPGSDITQEKLRGILRSGAFDFNSKERKALDSILNK